VQDALGALDNIAAWEVFVSLAGAVYTVTFNLAEDVAAMTAAHTFTGGTTPAIAVATTVPGTTDWGLYRPATNADTLTIGRTFALNETVVETDYMSDHAGGPMYGGKIFGGRLDVGRTGVPTLAAALAAMPRMQPQWEM
jgi:hypothetical protein